MNVLLFDYGFKGIDQTLLIADGSDSIGYHLTNVAAYGRTVLGCFDTESHTYPMPEGRGVCSVSSWGGWHNFQGVQPDLTVANLTSYI